MPIYTWLSNGTGDTTAAAGANVADYYGGNTAAGNALYDAVSCTTWNNHTDVWVTDEERNAQVQVQYEAHYHRLQYIQPQYAPTPETPAERVAREEVQAAQRLAHEERRLREAEEHQDAVETAEALLRQVLGPEYVEYEANGYLDVASRQHTGRTYRIRPDRLIEVLDADGNRVDTLCIHTADWVPPGDDVLAKKVLAEHDEERLLDVAISHGPGSVMAQW